VNTERRVQHEGNEEGHGDLGAPESAQNNTHGLIDAHLPNVLEAHVVCAQSEGKYEAKYTCKHQGVPFVVGKNARACVEKSDCAVRAG